MNTRGETFAGLIFLAGFVLFVAMMCTHGAWWDPMDPKEQAKFIVDAMVGLGTLALAVVTTYNVLQTRDVISAEDRRHQQGFAPLIVIAQRKTRMRNGDSGFILQPDGTGYTVSNVGAGIATSITIEIHKVLDTSRNKVVRRDDPTLSTEQAAHPNAKPLVIEGDLRGVYFWVEESVEAAAYRQFSAIPARSKSEIIELDADELLLLDRVKQIRLRATYYDQFGNEYRTDYMPTSGEPEEFFWVRPETLYGPTQGRAMPSAEALTSDKLRINEARPGGTES